MDLLNIDSNIFLCFSILNSNIVYTYLKSCDLSFHTRLKYDIKLEIPHFILYQYEERLSILQEDFEYIF